MKEEELEEINSKLNSFLLIKRKEYDFDDDFTVMFIAIFNHINKKHNISDYSYVYSEFFTWMKTEGDHWKSIINGLTNIELTMLFIKNFELQLKEIM